MGQDTLSADRVAIVDDGTAIGRTPTVVGYSRPSGRAEVADEVVGPNFAELWISIDESADYGKTVTEVQQIVDGYPGLPDDELRALREGRTR